MIRLPPFLKYPLRRRRLDRPPGFGGVGPAVPAGFGVPPSRGPWSAGRRAVLVAAIAAFLLAPAVAGVAAFRLTDASDFVSDLAFEILAFSVGVVAPAPETGSDGDPARPSAPVGAVPEGTRFDQSALDVPEWSSKERVNLILLGTDRRDDDIDVTRTDTILIVSMDPVPKSAGVLSLPRDLWVNIPGYGFERINTAFEIGEYQKKGGGPSLLRRTLEGLLGVPMHHYALVGFAGFRKVVDQLGGVIVDVERPFRDDEFPDGNYGMRRIIFQGGLQRLDGEMALWYVRSRHSDSDFGRNRRQRQFLLALRQQALQLNMLPKAPAMLASVLDSIKTDLRSTEILSLARVAKDIETSRLVSRAVDESMVSPWTTPGGAAVLLPDPVAIRHVVQEVFGSPGKLPTLPVARPQAPVPTPDVARSPIAADPRTPAASTPPAAGQAPVFQLGPGSFWVTPTLAPTGVPSVLTQAAIIGRPGTIPSPTARPIVTLSPGLFGATPATIGGTPPSGATPTGLGNRAILGASTFPAGAMTPPAGAPVPTGSAPATPVSVRTVPAGAPPASVGAVSTPVGAPAALVGAPTTLAGVPAPSSGVASPTVTAGGAPLPTNAIARTVPAGVPTASPIPQVFATVVASAPPPSPTRAPAPTGASTPTAPPR